MCTVGSEEEPVAWLRKTIKDDLAAAMIISAGGFAPERWDTEPPGQVNPEDIPQSDAVTAALGVEPEYICGWVELVAYDKLNNEPDERYGRDSEAPFALIDNGRREFDHVIRHDPRNVVADCEAKLAILDEHGDEHMCFKNSHDGNTWAGYDGDCKIVRLLASGYRHRPGYREEPFQDSASHCSYSCHVSTAPSAGNPDAPCSHA